MKQDEKHLIGRYVVRGPLPTGKARRDTNRSLRARIHDLRNQDLEQLTAEHLTQLDTVNKTLTACVRSKTGSTHYLFAADIGQNRRQRRGFA